MKQRQKENKERSDQTGGGGHHQRSRECIVPAFSSFDYDNAKTAVASREEGGGGCESL